MEEESKRNISDKWIDNNIYQALEIIELAERRMMTGCADLQEYIASVGAKISIPDIQLQNMKVMIREFAILIENSKKLIKKKDYLKVKDKIEAFKKIVREGRLGSEKEDRIFITSQDKVNKRPVTVTLGKPFWIVADHLAKLRSRMVEILSPILFVTSGKDKGVVEV